METYLDITTYLDIINQYNNLDKRNISTEFIKNFEKSRSQLVHLQI